MILSILFAYFGYKKASETGRNKILWAVALFVIYVGVQLVTGLLFGIVLGVGVELWGWSADALTVYYWPLNILGVLLSVGACSLVLFLLGRKPAIEPSATAPPPPPTFETE